jgi:hypothetical protein
MLGLGLDDGPHKEQASIEARGIDADKVSPKSILRSKHTLLLDFGLVVKVLMC